MMKNKKLILGILALVIVLISGCTEKECKTNEDCLTKDCFTVECKDNNCVYSPISDCCGNEICEIGETYGDCVADCQDCDDINDCTDDSFDYHKRECVNKPILDVVCCGNALCELGETYEKCTRDCPNCEDDNKCTKDSYDYHEQKCINEVIIPCCGNEICDEDAETYSSCPIECPNCNDDNKLTADSFNYATQKCENIVTHYFIDDFEEDTQNWEFPEPTAWRTIVEEGNTVLKGTGHYWANLKGKEWTNYIFRVRFKIIEGAAHFNYRGEWPSRYFIGVGRSFYLNKQINKSFYDLVDKSITLDEGWHSFEIRGYGNILNIYIDDELLIKYKDTDDPILSGGIAFETLDDSEFLLDDVEIKVISEEDIVYP